MLNIICIMLFIAIYDVLIIFSPGLRSPVQIVVEVLETLFKCRKKLIGWDFSEKTQFDRIIMAKKHYDCQLTQEIYFKKGGR